MDSPTDFSSPPPHKLAKLEDPIKPKFRQYLDQFASAVRTGKFVVQTELSNVPTIGLKVIPTGKVLKFPLQEDEVSIEEIATADFEIKNKAEWVKLEASIVAEVGTGFGLPKNRISVSLKKLLIQKSGSTFPTNLAELFNRSEEDVDNQSSPSKRTACFGHLVIQLPSDYTGGHFRFENEEQLREFDMSVSIDSKEGWIPQYLAFYPKLRQNHGEILAGVRSCLVYNLEIESSTDAPQAPTISTISPSLPQIIQEWKQRSDKSVELLPLVYNTYGIDPSVVSTFLAPTLRDNGVTLFQGKMSISSYFAGSAENSVLTKRVLASPRGQVEDAFANFLRDEPIKHAHRILSDCDTDSDDDEDIHYADSRGLKFDVDGLEIEPATGFRSDNFVFFLSEDLFENERWIQNVQFWRFQSYLFVADFGGENPTVELLEAADTLVSVESDEEEFKNLFPHLPHFKNLLAKFLLLEDSNVLTKFFQVCTNQSNFNKLFLTILKSGMPWSILKAGLQNLFDPAGVENGSDFYSQLEKFKSHVETVFHARDKNCEKFYFDVFDTMLQKFQEFRNAEEFISNKLDVQLVLCFLRISQVMKYNLFKFMKSQRAKFVRKVIFLSSKSQGSMMGVTWVNLVTDLYCCTNLLKKWPKQRVGVNIPEELLFLSFFFQLAERVGADVLGILGSVKKYGFFVRALEHVVKNRKQPRVLSKFWIPFASRLESRIEAVMEDTTRPEQSAHSSVGKGTKMLNKIRKLLESAKGQQ